MPPPLSNMPPPPGMIFPPGMPPVPAGGGPKLPPSEEIWVKNTAQEGKVRDPKQEIVSVSGRFDVEMHCCLKNLKELVDPTCQVFAFV